jgi:hypothetical protein
MGMLKRGDIKMVKKCLIVVVALLATTVQAATYPVIKKDPGHWPWTYDTIDICTFPVKLEIGHYVQLYKCNKLKITLKQTDCSDINQSSSKFPCYGDGDSPACVTIKARANFPAIFGAVLARSGTGITSVIHEDKFDLFWFGDDNTIAGSTGDWESLKLCLSAWQVELWKAGSATGTITVGQITINVKPPPGP